MLRTVVIIGISMILGFSVPHYFMEYKAVHGFGLVHTGKGWVLIRYIHCYIIIIRFNLYALYML
ncbi:hypothetical protein MtrunA17_Chr7g0267451 [Medicago truncatula]|uniref:Transmembrane protein n=1 Tax=Medicago truncatula TaxID=3880 RepID=A0A396H7P4_MEDTR|nr:hypothetical protein MtrunA17_Chr7g0267451 [Medicago truncatula]